jgi:hypothetical protein
VHRGSDSRSESGDELTDGLLFYGNPHESVPRALFTDVRLTPLERNAWQVIRMQVSQDGLTAFPTYESLRPHLSSLPCGGQASDETIARALTLLRLSRWLSLVRHRKRGTDGRILGNLYLLQDEPLTPSETIQLDPHYFSLVSDSLTHASKAVQRVGFHTLMELSTDSALSEKSIPTRLNSLTRRFAIYGTRLLQTNDGDELDPLTDSSSIGSTAEPHSDPAPSSRTSESEDGKVDPLRNPKGERTVRTVSINNLETVRTEPGARDSDPHRSLSYWLDRLRPEQRSGALATLQQLGEPLRQAVLEEWATRCAASTVHNPSRYLFGLIQRALRGEFHQRMGAPIQGKGGLRTDLHSPRATVAEPPPEAHQHIQHLRTLLRIR